MGIGNRILRRLRRRKLRFGDLSGTEPLSRDFGLDRGTPVDRYYIERFLADRAAVIAGRTLEVGDDSYTCRFGGDRTTRRDVIHIDPAVSATYHGDLSSPGVLPHATFDCAVITQTLHLIYDMKAAVTQLREAMAPGGVLLATMPGISQIARDEWGKTWFWSLTALSATQLFGDVFGEANVTVRSHGNVFAATAFLQGVAAEEVDRAKLDVVDPLYPVTIAVEAVRR